MSDRSHLGVEKNGAIFPVAPTLLEAGEGYAAFIADLKREVQNTRLSVVAHANVQLINLYWHIGDLILDAQAQQGWGAKIIDRISHDLQASFPDMKGFSASNLKYMKRFASAWPDGLIGQQPVDQLPWGSNIVLLTKLDNREDRLWYAHEALENGWSRAVLSLQIDAHAKERSGKALTNFSVALPPADSDMAQQVFKDPYLFDFLGTDAPRREAEVEQALTDHIQQFLLELGRGFAFVGRQVPLEVGGDTFRLDMLFYHLKLRCYIVIELKAGEFRPGYISQLNMYQHAVDDLLRHEDDDKTIGLLLVKEKNDVVVEYSLGGLESPIGVADWQTSLQESLPRDIQSSLPTVEELECELEGRHL